MFGLSIIWLEADHETLQSQLPHVSGVFPLGSGLRGTRCARREYWGPSGLDGPSSSGVELRINIYDFAGTL
jgi:hypothetical protein